jgi:hypothetical protein
VGTAEQVIFETQTGELSLVKASSNLDLLRSTVKCKDLTELAQILRQLDKGKGEYYWVELFFGIQLELNAPDGWDAPILWHNCLDPWETWLA